MAEWIVKYVAKDRIKMKQSMKGSMTAYVDADDRESAIKAVKKENKDFGELISAKEDKNTIGARMPDKKLDEKTKPEMKPTTNEIVIEAADFRFVDFSNTVLSNADRNIHSEDWFVKLRELDAKIHSNNLNDKINMSDDRLILVAYKAMVKSEAFSRPGLREWWIVYRYLDLYVKDIPLLAGLQKLVNMHIGFTFSKAEPSEDQKAEMKGYTDALSKVVYEDGYIELPEFVLNVIESKSVKKSKETFSGVEYDFANDPTAQWKGLRDVAKMMLSYNDLTDEETNDWEGALALADMMLDQ